MTLNERREKEIQQSIFEQIDNFRSFRFNAGAGSGKTYALIETLKYVSVHKILSKKSPQKIACVTYTNVAVNEIKGRLGNSDLVHVSTIHERVWDVIKRSQPELLKCHKEKIEETLEHIEQDLQSSGKSSFFNGLSEDEKRSLVEFIFENKDIYYRAKNLNAAGFRGAYIQNSSGDVQRVLRGCLSNIANFKYVIALLYKKDNLQKCLKRIIEGKEKRVTYDSKTNTDRLHNMKFSHDTLLEYGLKLVTNYKTLCRIIIDTYPYFFIDEYQDTNENVVYLLKAIHEYAVQNDKSWMVGYFGDTAQNIYEDGVGERICELHGELFDINKEFNRRSHVQIIEVVNKIRDDSIIQEPIYEDKNHGSVVFFHKSSENKIEIAKQFLSLYSDELEGSTDLDENSSCKINCLVLTNQLMAEFNGFKDVYNAFKSSTIYYDQLSTLVLSQQLEKLHPTALSIYHLVKLYHEIKKSEASYYDIFGAHSKNMTFSEASLIIREIKDEEIETLDDWCNLIITKLESEDLRKNIVRALDNCTNYDRSSIETSEAFRATLIDSIHSLMLDGTEEHDEVEQKTNNILGLPIRSLVCWINFIDGFESDKFSYHTYHGTKGEEYDNVAIILEHNFGSRSRNKFKNYFDFLQKTEEERDILLSDQDFKNRHTNTKNLLYVACSRAVKNLKVLYLDDISEIKNGIEHIFGEVNPWLGDDIENITSV
ncbi:UvrD-helicase domain-containing protein [Vibrio parahaemolyticus]|uniref:UvrD-helicase domain-containing protein n=1 Tax=Vibrio parahaemolyticus TaxID=670 RepID=UPI000D7274EA|nr:UvrD-helicase domain-containing protein [Vibrio parahaemolyticus]EGR3325440.1 ATP-dependent helicase [Vibrio parahaemolyticus]MDF4285444.1 UvrD-helicase domain-containing protein [Vibrio parahaemolyticus]MDF4966707.1 UvrD-helicase domain-containing protein [Vibrio parahaemolyticus]MDF5029367.1 UvrD-helicase domain-containing protein [Vibrio parahaemolyticus]MDF5063542.1 UvrD-helicase domain-containing protein [Vibrio parahaemolyticus]